MPKPYNAGFEPGNWWVNCQRCGFDYRVAQVKKEWTGLVVCEECWETRQPQDFVRGVSDKIAPEGPTIPPPSPTYTSVTYGAETDAHDVPDATFGNNID